MPNNGKPITVPGDSRSPVTVIARHSVNRGKEELFDEWMRGIVNACSRFEGYLNSEVIRPIDPLDDYVCIFRFDVFANLDRWLQSDERQRWLGRTSEFSSRAPRFEHYHSLEFWFDPGKRRGAPSRSKMALVTFSVIWPLVHFIPRFVRSHVTAPALLTEVVSVATIVVLMTWVVMPAVTRLLEAWLWRDQA